MESDEVDDKELMLERTLPSMQIDPGRARFPCCIVWAPLPFISWLVPFIGHIGICREDGVILDFAGPNFVCVDSFAFGAAARYIQINREKCYFSLSSNGHPAEDNFNETEPERKMMWDDALRMSTQEFQHRSYSLFTCNCHCFVANSLNRMHYGGHNHWNVVNLAAYIFLKGHWVNKTSIVRSYLPFTVVVLLGILLGGLTFLIGLAVFAAILVSWFIIGTYCFKNLIEL